MEGRSGARLFKRLAPGHRGCYAIKTVLHTGQNNWFIDQPGLWAVEHLPELVDLSIAVAAQTDRWQAGTRMETGSSQPVEPVDRELSDTCTGSVSDRAKKSPPGEGWAKHSQNLRRRSWFQLVAWVRRLLPFQQ